MAFPIDPLKVRSSSTLQGAPATYVKSDTQPMLVGGFYPRGFQVLMGGTITVWVEDPSNSGQSIKRDLPEVPDGYTWAYGGVYGIAATNEAGVATTCDNIIAIP